MQAHDLVALFAQAINHEDPMHGAREAMNALTRRLGEVSNALAYLSGTGGNAAQAFYRAANLSMLKVSFPAGRRTPPHNHGTWALILVLSGREKNTLYLRDTANGLRRTGEVLLEPGAVLPMRAEAIHVAECVGDEPAIGLHVYGANVLGVERRMWNPETLEEQVLDWSRYEPLAQRASKAAAAPLS